MPKSRSIKSTLYQLLNEALPPVYILDDKGNIVFANLALCSWLNIEFSEIEMEECVPTTDVLSAEPANTIRGLAIPSSAYRTANSKGQVFRTAADKHLIWREATYQRLTGSSDLAGNVLVTLAESDSDSNAKLSGDNTSWSRQLIAGMRSFKTQQLGLDRFTGISLAAAKFNQQIQLACANQANLLLSGPNGSMLAELASTIHAARSPEPKTITPINCTMADAQTVQESILQARQASNESELWFQLDHPEKLLPGAANELMGFLQLPRHNMKFISICVDANAIQKDLACYLDTVSIKFPPLNQRKEDIPFVADLFLKQVTANPMIEFDEDAKEALIDYDWPNNLLELEQTVQQTGVVADAEFATLADLPDRFRHALQAQQIGGNAVPEIKLDEYLASIEAELIGRALNQANHNKAKACKLLGISRAKLGRRIQQLGLSESADPIVFEESVDEDE
jgi:transcriptional regulator with PAS, ATPase and Fis domain